MNYTIYDYLGLFFLYAFLGWLLETTVAAVRKKHMVNRGFLNGPLCAIYGITAVFMTRYLYELQSSPVFLFLGCMIIATAAEWIAGHVLERIGHGKWWDYSKLPFNIGGYVCLLFSLIWGVACVFIVYFVHPLIHQVLSLIPHTAGIALIAILGIALLSDMIVTTSAIVKFNQYLELLKHITDELHAISNQIGAELYQNVMHVLDMQESSRQKLDDVKLEVSEEIRM